MELTTIRDSWRIVCLGLCLAVGGCASTATLAGIDAKYDRILAEECGGDRRTCGLQEANRIREKEYANSPMHRLGNYLGLKGGNTGSSATNYVTILNP